MLINSSTNFKKDDIITLKNNLGEEIICKYIEEDSTHYTINHPVALGMGQQGMQFMPPVVSADMTGDVKFPKAFTMWFGPTIPEIQTAYIQQTTGIAVPTESAKKIIV